DPIEFEALRQAFAIEGRPGTCAIGALKSNVGHLDAAAGIAGLIKTTLCLEHKALVPSLHYNSPNPEIDFARSPCQVSTAFAPWMVPGEQPRRAGVSSFGIGGTNAHAVLEEAPKPASSGPSRGAQALLVSARTPAALDAATRRLAEHL